MVCGTSSDAGKSYVAAGLCRALARRGVRVAPFKGQNMSLNSTVTVEGAEIGRAQWVQAVAAGAEPEAAMNPVLLKPTGDRTSQVVVLGRPWRTLDAAEYRRAKADLVGVVDEALADLRRRYDLVVLEGAGSPAEVNLLDHDLVNLGLAARAGLPAVVVGDIDRGGVFAHLFGTVALLPETLRRSVRGFVINKFRGDPALLGGATAELEERCGVPTLGVLPFLPGAALDAEDSMGLAALAPAHTGAPAGAGLLDVAVVRFPRIANFTDVEPLALEPGVSVRLVGHPAALGDPDLVVLPGTKATVADLAWLQDSGLAAAVARLRRRRHGPVLLGLCGGYQMLGRRIEDPDAVESPRAAVDGLGWLDLTTRFGPAKRTARRRGVQPEGGIPVAGYEIHHGIPRPGPGAVPWLRLDPAAGADGRQEEEGVRDDEHGVLGTSLHGLFESDLLRAHILVVAAHRRRKVFRPSGVSFEAARSARLDRVADACEDHLDLEALIALAREARVSVPARRAGPTGGDRAQGRPARSGEPTG